MKPSPRVLGWLILPLLLFALNFGLKYAYIDAVQIGLDEPFTIFYAQMPPGEIVEAYAYSNSPPMLELILHPWMKVFGASPAAVRFPSLLFACFSAVLLLWLGWKVHSLRVGLWAALFYTLSTWMTYFAHEARVYALFGMLTVASLLCLLWLRARPASWWRTCAFAAVTLLLAYSHYFAFFVIAWQCLWILLAVHPDRRTLIWRAGIAVGLVVLLYLPSATLLLMRLEETAGDHWVGLSNLPALYHTLAKYLNQPIVAVAVLLLLAGAGLRWLVWRRKGKAGVTPEVLLVLGIFPGTFLLVWALGLFLPMFLDRYVIFALQGLYLVMGLSIAYILPLRWQQWALAGVLLVLLGATTDLARDPRSQWREVAAKVRARWEPGDVVLLYPAYTHFSFTYYFDPTVFQDHAHYEARQQAAGILRVIPYKPLKAQDLADAPHVWVISTGGVQAKLSPAVDSLLRVDYRPAPAVEGNEGISISGYVREE